MKYKVGDLVRVVKGFDKGLIFEVESRGRDVFGEIIYINNRPYKQNDDFLEPVTHLTTKEFIKLVEDLGYGVEEYLAPENLSIENDDGRLALIYTNAQYFLDTDYGAFDCLTNNEKEQLFKLLTLYANTPLELREEKEQLFTLEMPNAFREILNQKLLLVEYGYSTGFGFLSENELKHYIKYEFTQKEIDELKEHNADLINALIKKEVKENE